MTSESGVPQLSEVHIDTDRYVPRRTSISRVVRALESSTSPSVVIVHGGPGTGKYSLTRYITSYYSAERTCVFPDGIHVVPCGKGACVSDRGLYLMHLLGCWPQAGDEESFGSNEQTLAASISYCLEQSLEQRAALIILENVWDPELLKMLVRPVKRCKYLVTAQKPRVCRDARLDAVVVPIQTINSEDGLRIFFNGLGPAGEECVNSSSSRDAADDVLCAINYNPLIVENLSVVFYHQCYCRLASADKPEIAQVNLLKDEFWAELRLESSRVESYPYGFSSSMKLLSSHLSFHEKKLMLMVAMFDGMSVPEYVIKILWDCLHDGKVCFETILHHLSSLRLVRIDYDMVPSRQKIIYIHPLRKHYLVHDAPTTPESFDLLQDLSRAKARDIGFCTEFCLGLCFVYGISSLRGRVDNKLKAFPLQTMLFGKSTSDLLHKRIWLNQILPTLLNAITGTEVSDSKYKIAAETILSDCLEDRFACTEEFMQYLQLEKCQWVGLCWVLCVIQFHHIHVSTQLISAILEKILASAVELSKSAGCHATTKQEIIQTGRNLLEQEFVRRASRNCKDVRDIVLRLRDFLQFGSAESNLKKYHEINELEDFHDDSYKDNLVSSNEDLSCLKVTSKSCVSANSRNEGGIKRSKRKSRALTIIVEAEPSEFLVTVQTLTGSSYQRGILDGTTDNIHRQEPDGTKVPMERKLADAMNRRKGCKDCEDVAFLEREREQTE